MNIYKEHISYDCDDLKEAIDKRLKMVNKNERWVMHTHRKLTDLIVDLKDLDNRCKSYTISKFKKGRIIGFLVGRYYKQVLIIPNDCMSFDLIPAYLKSFAFSKHKEVIKPL